jgi:hypothetical protein
MEILDHEDRKDSGFASLPGRRREIFTDTTFNDLYRLRNDFLEPDCVQFGKLQDTPEPASLSAYLFVELLGNLRTMWSEQAIKFVVIVFSNT